jgi:hypothetical protein
VHGKKKGYLGKALAEAMEKWTDEKRETDTVAATLSLLDHGIDLADSSISREMNFMKGNAI